LANDLKFLASDQPTAGGIYTGCKMTFMLNTKQQINTFVTNFRTKIQTTPCFLYLFNGFFLPYFVIFLTVSVVLN